MTQPRDSEVTSTPKSPYKSDSDFETNKKKFRKDNEWNVKDESDDEKIYRKEAPMETPHELPLHEQPERTGIPQPDAEEHM